LVFKLLTNRCVFSKLKDIALQIISDRVNVLQI
jgi:hypothetical protein